MAGLRIVFDTNVLVSGLAYPTSVPGRIVGAWRGGRLDVVLSRYILAELLRVLPRLNHRLQWREEDMLDMVDALACWPIWSNLPLMPRPWRDRLCATQRTALCLAPCLLRAPTIWSPVTRTCSCWHRTTPS